MMGDAGGFGGWHHRRFLRVDAAFRDGDLVALRGALPDPDLVPGGPMPPGIGGCLEYAIYHSPLPFIRELLELGADPTPEEHAGFPPLIAALTRPTRTDWPKVLRVLLDHGADPDQRGLNDYTALHVAVREGNREAVKILLAAGADPEIRTRIDDYESPRDIALRLGLSDIAQLLRSKGAANRVTTGKEGLSEDDRP